MYFNPRKRRGEFMPKGVFIRTEEHKKNISNALKGKPSGMLGKSHTAESKIKMSDNHIGMKGKKHSKESKERMSASKIGENNYFFGRNLSEKHKFKISEVRKALFLSGDLINPMEGRSHTDETKKKMSEDRKGKPSARKGKNHTAESKRKMSDAHWKGGR